jgi:hypothetical protein
MSTQAIPLTRRPQVYYHEPTLSEEVVRPPYGEPDAISSPIGEGRAIIWEARFFVPQPPTKVISILVKNDRLSTLKTNAWYFGIASTILLVVFLGCLEAGMPYEPPLAAFFATFGILAVLLMKIYDAKRV